uniref:Uncharacterized protein n=1 Tax=Romanomermis culicivorax TaxID=13658 RepID=A0A915J9D1_ROMCU
SSYKQKEKPTITDYLLTLIENNFHNKEYFGRRELKKTLYAIGERAFFVDDDSTLHTLTKGKIEP